jgi:hypothetical protein
MVEFSLGMFLQTFQWLLAVAFVKLVFLSIDLSSLFLPAPLCA